MIVFKCSGVRVFVCSGVRVLTQSRIPEHLNTIN